MNKSKQSSIIVQPEKPVLPASVAQYTALAELPQVLNYVGEFGAELVLFLPFCKWLSDAGLLRNRSIRTYRGMRCFYDDLDCAEILERVGKRDYVKADKRPNWLPIKNEHDFDGGKLSPLLKYPDMRAKFSKVPLPNYIENLDKPILVVHNKYNNEWKSGPINYLSIEILTKIFHRFQDKFQIIYVRHGINAVDSNFSDDHNWTHPFDDRLLLDAHPAVICFDTIYEDYVNAGGELDINSFKSTIYSRAYYFISSQGGGAHHIAMFSGSLMIVFHRRGREEDWAYGNGYYGFMASIPPVRAICRNGSELLSSLDLLDNAGLSEDRILLAPAMAPLLKQLSPRTIADRKKLPKETI